MSRGPIERRVTDQPSALPVSGPVPGPIPEIARHGDEGEPVAIFDAFARDPYALVEDATFLAFTAMGKHYPGVRAIVPPAIVAPMLAAIAPTVRSTFGSGGNLSVVDAFYSLVTTPPAALAPIQRLPHFDEVSPTRLALLLYLAQDERSGTAFFRQRATGYERVDAGRLPAYRAALDRGIREHGLPAPSYIAGDTPMFEEIARHAGLFNRAILYRSHLLHCAAIPPDMTFSADPAIGRLTLNLFLDCA